LRPGAAQHLWQPNYYEHIIRHERAFNSIRDYILTNAERWTRDSENPHGDRTDDFDAFIRSLNELPNPKKGDAGVAATRGKR